MSGTTASLVADGLRMNGSNVEGSICSDRARRFVTFRHDSTPADILACPGPRDMASLTQRLVMRLMPRRAAEIERQSRQWEVVCSSCGHTRSYWDIGGVRYKAASVGKRIGLKCPSCGQRGLHAVVRRPDDTDTVGSSHDSVPCVRAVRSSAALDLTRAAT